MARQLVIELVGEAGKFVKSLDDADKATGSFGDKVKNAGKKMTAFATVPIIGFLGAATKGAMEDAAAQDHLAKTLSNVGESSKSVVSEVEKYITGAMKASTFTDDQLRPAFEDLVRSSGSAQGAMNLMNVAMDVATGKGIDLETATKAVAKASEGQFAAVNKLVPGLLDLKDKSLTAESATAQLAKLFAGDAQAATETAAGKAQMMTRDLGELTEQIGSVLVPVIGKMIEIVRPAIDWFAGLDSKWQTMIVGVGLLVAAIGPLIGVVTALGTAIAFVAANPIVLIIAAVAALAAGLFIAYQKSETFRNLVDTAFDQVQRSVETMWHIVEPILNAFKGVLERLTGPLNTVLGLAGKAGGFIGGIVGKLPGFANGGMVGGAIGQAQLAVVHGGERITPYRGGDSGGGSGGTVVNISVGGSIISERDLGRTVADALRDNGLYGIG